MSQWQVLYTTNVVKPRKQRVIEQQGNILHHVSTDISTAGWISVEYRRLDIPTASWISTPQAR
jgi:hypothetical protein